MDGHLTHIPKGLQFLFSHSVFFYLLSLFLSINGATKMEKDSDNDQDNIINSSSFT